MVFQKKFKWCLNLMDVSRKFQGYFKEVLRLLTENFKGVSMKFKGVSRRFQKCFKEVSGKSQGCLMKGPRVLEKDGRIFQVV